MTQKEILQAVFDKAHANGWEEAAYKLSRIAVEYNSDSYEGKLNNLSYPFIFSHAFAKAFWGDTLCGFSVYVYKNNEKPEEGAMQLWAFHLQQMVVAEDPIEYLSKFI